MTTQLTDKDRKDAQERAKQLTQAIMMNGGANATLLIEAYIQEAILYGKTGVWYLDAEWTNDAENI